MSDNSSVGENAPTATPFSLTPAMVHHGIIDYSVTSGRKMYSSATARLSDDLYDCNSDELYAFLKALKERAREYG